MTDMSAIACSKSRAPSFRAKDSARMRIGGYRARRTQRNPRRRRKRVKSRRHRRIRDHLETYRPDASWTTRRSSNVSIATPCFSRSITAETDSNCSQRTSSTPPRGVFTRFSARGSRDSTVRKSSTKKKSSKQDPSSTSTTTSWSIRATAVRAGGANAARATSPRDTPISSSDARSHSP